MSPFYIHDEYISEHNHLASFPSSPHSASFLFPLFTSDLKQDVVWLAACSRFWRTNNKVWQQASGGGNSFERSGGDRSIDRHRRQQQRRKQASPTTCPAGRMGNPDIFVGPENRQSRHANLRPARLPAHKKKLITANRTSQDICICYREVWVCKGPRGSSLSTDFQRRDS